MADSLFAIAGFSPWQCVYCARRAHKVHIQQLVLVVTVCVAALGVSFALLPSSGRANASTDMHMAPRSDSASSAQESLESTPDTEGGFELDAENILNNADVAQMSAAKLKGEVIIRLIRNSPHSFRVDPRSLIELKEQGTSDDVIQEMIDVTASYLTKAKPHSAAEPVGRNARPPAVRRAPGPSGMRLTVSAKTASLR